LAIVPYPDSSVSLVLASASPRRRELLAQLGVRFRSTAAEIDETRLASEEAVPYALRVATAKGRAVADLESSAELPVLAADTVVALDGHVLQKPADREQGVEMLMRLAGREHDVISAVVVVHGGVLRTSVNRTAVRFSDISMDQANRYWDTGEPEDKAGGYAIQGLGAVFVAHIEGSYSAVMGLPLFETARLLEQCGIVVL